MITFTFFFIFLFLFSESFADSCNPQNLKIDLLTEFYTCKTDQRVDYLKNYSSIREWNEDSVCNLCLEKIRPKKINKISIKNENQLKKKDEVKGSNTEVVRKAFKNVKNPEIKRLRNEKITKKITEKPPNITENLDSKDLSKRLLYCSGRKRHATFMFDVKIYFEFRNDYLGRMSEFIITKKSDWASKGWLSYGFDPALNEIDFYYETRGINDGISTEKINISFLNPDSDLYLACDNGHFSNNGTLECRKQKPSPEYGSGLAIGGNIVIDRTTLRLDNSIMKKGIEFLFPIFGSLLTGSYSDVKCERSYDLDDKKKKIIFPYRQLKVEYDSYLESRKGKNKI